VDREKLEAIHSNLKQRAVEEVDDVVSGKDVDDQL
jgi:hypothetical protein